MNIEVSQTTSDRTNSEPVSAATPDFQVIRDLPVLDPPPKPKSRKPFGGVLLMIAATAITALTYRNRLAAITFLNGLFPYAGTLASFTAGIVPLCFRDWRKYHPVIAYGLFLTFCLLASATGVNTFRERRNAAEERRIAAEEKRKTADTILGLEQSVRTLKKSVDDVTGSVKKVNPEALRSEMSGLRTTMEKVVHPPKAELLFSFAPGANPPADGDRTVVPIRDITLPLQPDGSVRTHITLINNTEVPADAALMAIEICVSCKFTKEPEKFIKVEGSPDTMRNHIYGDMPAGGPFEVMIVDITPPPNAPAFNIQVSHRCKTCVLQRTGTIGTIHIARN